MSEQFFSHAQKTQFLSKYDNNAHKPKLFKKNSNLMIILAKPEYEQIKKRAHVLSKEEKLSAIEENNKKRIQFQAESNNRKELLQKLQLHKKSKLGSKLVEAENEASRKNLYILQRALELHQEQDDEVKNANSVILATKCLAIREAQIMEKQLIRKELQEENRGLDMMMEQERQKAIKEEQFEKQKQKEKTQKYAKEISEQMLENEQQRLAEAESREEEIRRVNRAQAVLKLQESEELKWKRMRRQKIIEDLNKTNAEIEHHKLLEKEKQRIADLQIQEFMQKKAQREAAGDLELMHTSMLREREIICLRNQQQKVQDQKAILDEINSLRLQEEVEREWREKEKAAANKRKQQAEELKIGREQQIEQLRKAQAIEIERDEQQFHQIAKVQKELHMKELKNICKRKEAAIQHRNDLLKQMNEKQMEHIKEHKLKFDDGVALRLQQENHNQQIQNLIKKKVQRLRDRNIAEHYITDIERQLNLL